MSEVKKILWDDPTTEGGTKNAKMNSIIFPSRESIEIGMTIFGTYKGKDVTLIVKETVSDTLFICNIEAFETVTEEYEDLKLGELVEITKDKIYWINK